MTKTTWKGGTITDSMTEKVPSSMRTVQKNPDGFFPAYFYSCRGLHPLLDSV